MCQARQRLLEVTGFPRMFSSSTATLDVLQKDSDQHSRKLVSLKYEIWARYVCDLRLVHEMKTVSTSSLDPTLDRKSYKAKFWKAARLTSVPALIMLAGVTPATCESEQQVPVGYTMFLDVIKVPIGCLFVLEVIELKIDKELLGQLNKLNSLPRGQDIGWMWSRQSLQSPEPFLAISYFHFLADFTPWLSSAATKTLLTCGKSIKMIKHQILKYWKLHLGLIFVCRIHFDIIIRSYLSHIRSDQANLDKKIIFLCIGLVN